MAGQQIGSMNIKVGFDGSDASEGLAKLTNDLSKFGSDTEKYFEKFNQLGQLIGSIGKGGGFSIAALAGITAAIGKTVMDATRLSVEFEKAGHNVENLKKQMDQLAAKDHDWGQMGVVGKASSVPGMAYDGLVSGLAQAIKGLGEFTDQLTGLGGFLDNFYKEMGNLSRGDTGPISALINSLGGRGLNDWSDNLVGAKSQTDRENDRLRQAEVIAREKRAGKERQDFEKQMEDLRKSLTSASMTEEEKFKNSIDELDKVIKDVFSRREGADFRDVAGLAQKRKQQLIDEQQQKLADAAKKAADEQQKLADAQMKAAEEAAKAAERLAQELENLVSSVRTPAEQFNASLQELSSLFNQAAAAGDQTKAEVYRRKIGRLGAGLLNGIPEIKQADPFAGVSLAGSQEAYRDRIMSQFPPEVRSVQDRMAEALDKIEETSREQLQIEKEAADAIKANANHPALAHMF